MIAGVSALPAGTVTFLFTDIEGSTRLLQQLGDRYGDVVRDHRRIVREALQQHRGSEVDTQGDAFFYSFARARDAVAGAVDAQRALAQHEWPDGTDVRVRMGLHTGEPTVGEEGYLGLDVVRAARICSAGSGGQILLSETTRALLGNDVPDGAAVVDLGQQNLKDIQHERIFQLALEDGPSEFPPLKTYPHEDSPDTLAERINRRVNEHVQQQLEQALAPRGRPEPNVTKLALSGIAISFVVIVAIGAALILLVKLAF
jgi:class 3 adenylate cyclase